MESKESKILLIVLTVLVVGMAGYIVYDKISAPKNPGTLNEKTKESTNKEVADNNEATKCPEVTCPEGGECNCPKCNDEFISSNLSTEFTDAEIKDAIQRFINLSITAGTRTDAFIEFLGFSNLNVEWKENYKGYSSIAVTNVKYADFKNKVLEYMSDYWYESHFAEWRGIGKNYIDMDGNLAYISDGGSGAVVTVERVYKVKDTNEYVAILDQQDINTSHQKTIGNYMLTKQNGRCVVDYAG